MGNFLRYSTNTEFEQNLLPTFFPENTRRKVWSNSPSLAQESPLQRIEGMTALCSRPALASVGVRLSCSSSRHNVPTRFV